MKIIITQIATCVGVLILASDYCEQERMCNIMMYKYRHSGNNVRYTSNLCVCNWIFHACFDPFHTY